MKSIQRCKASVEIRNLSVVYNHNLNCFWEWIIVNCKPNFVAWKSYMLIAEKDIFSSCDKYGTKKKFWVPMRNWTSNLRIPRSDALPLSYRDSMVSEVYYEVHMTHELFFRNEYHLAYFLLILNSKRSISARMKRKISLLHNFETSRLNSTRYFSQSKTTHVMLWMHGWVYVSIFTMVAP